MIIQLFFSLLHEFHFDCILIYEDTYLKLTSQYGISYIEKKNDSKNQLNFYQKYNLCFFENCFDVFMDYRGFSFLLEPSIIGYEEKDKGSMQNSLRLDEWIRVDARENQWLARGTVIDSVFFLSLSLSLSPPSRISFN